MKRRLISFTASFLTALALSCGVVFCLTTAFAIPVDSRRAALCCFAAAALAGASFSLPKSWLWIALLSAGAGAFCLWKGLPLEKSAAVFAHAVTEQYALAFDWVRVVHTQTDAGDATLFCCLLGAMYALLGGWAAARRGNLAYVLAVCALPLVLCLILLETPPAWWAVLPLLCAMALLALTHAARTRDAEEGGRLLVVLSLPLAAMMLLLALVFPQSGYTRAQWPDRLRQSVMQAGEKFTLLRRDESTGELRLTLPQTVSTLGRYVWDSRVTGFDLGSVGPQRQYGLRVMRVQAPVSGVCHLRGMSFGVYEDNQWKQIPEEAYRNSDADEYALLAEGDSAEFLVETDAPGGICYIPYKPVDLPEGMTPYYDAYVRNPARARSYQLEYSSQYPSVLTYKYQQFVRDTYTYLPDSTKQALSGVLTQIPIPYGDRSEKNLANAVREYVMNSARYSLQTEIAPEGEDFAAWFLTESETGYCVHFASAAAVLLRCYGVPARFTTGYLIRTQAGEWTDVSTNDAHAWVEYFVEGEGWYVLDPTPQAQNETQPEPTPQPAEPDPAVQTPDPAVTRPEGNEQQQTDKNENDSQIKTPLHLAWYAWAGILLIAAVLFWQALLRLLRKAAFTRGSNNERAVAYYRHMQFLHKLDHGKTTEEMRALAEKARFSRHRITDEELERMQAYCRKICAELTHSAPIWKKLLYRLLLALPD